MISIYAQKEQLQAWVHMPFPLPDRISLSFFNQHGLMKASGQLTGTTGSKS